MADMLPELVQSVAPELSATIVPIAVMVPLLAGRTVAAGGVVLEPSVAHG